MIQNGDIETEEKDELMTLLANQVGNTRSMLNELLSWANSQLDESKTEIKPFKLKSVIESVKHLYEDAFTLKSINFTLLVDESDFFVLGDENQIKIILQNLVSNALKFTPSGGEVILRKYQENNSLIIEIEDNGIGMKENLISSLNKDSFSNTTNGTQQEEGSGLGLLLVRQFSLNNHIGFHIDSETNKGTLIRLTFREVVQDNNVLAVESYN
jgi:signal transduction histidine kinase